jgi:hypothetical protein
MVPLVAQQGSQSLLPLTVSEVSQIQTSSLPDRQVARQYHLSSLVGTCHAYLPHRIKDLQMVHD